MDLIYVTVLGKRDHCIKIGRKISYLHHSVELSLLSKLVPRSWPGNVRFFINYMLHSKHLRKFQFEKTSKHWGCHLGDA